MPVGSTEAEALWVYLKCDAASGGFSLTDSSGNARTAFILGSASFLSSGGVSAGCVSLGSSGSINVAVSPNPAFSWGPACTVSIWFRKDSGTGADRALFRTADDLAGFYVGADDKLKFTDAGGLTASGVGGVATGAWKHCVLVVEADGHVRIAVDGVTEYYGGGYSTSGFTTGKIGCVSSMPPNGSVDEVRVYQGALTESQVAALHASMRSSTVGPAHAASASGTYAGAAIRHGTASAAIHHGSSATARSSTPASTGSASAAAVHAASASASYAHDDCNGSSSVLAGHAAAAAGSYFDDDAAGGALVGVAASVSASGTVVTPSFSGSATVAAAHRVATYAYYGILLSDSASLPMIIAGSDGPGAIRGLNLATTGGGPLATAGLPVVVANTPPATRALRLFLRGPDGTPGAVPSSTPMNLWVEWGGQGSLPLAVGPPSDGGTLPMFVAPGIASGSGSVPVTIEADGGVIYEGLDLAIPDVVGPTAASGSVEVAIPATTGLASAGLKTLINGWGS